MRGLFCFVFTKQLPPAAENQDNEASETQPRIQLRINENNDRNWIWLKLLKPAYLCQKAVWGTVMSFQDERRHRVAILKLWIIVEIWFEKLGLLFLNIKWLDGCKDAELLGIFHSLCDLSFVQWGEFSTSWVRDARLSDKWNCTSVQAHFAAHYCDVPHWFREAGVVAWENTICQCRFTTIFVSRHPFKSHVCVVFLNKWSTTFHCCFWPLVQRML